MQETDRRCSPEELEIRRISDHEWRIGDARVDEESPDKVLGYIQHRGLRFEVLDMSAPLTDAIFDRWDDAVGSFAL